MPVFRVVFEALLKIALTVLLAWVLHGSVAREDLFLLVALGIAARGYWLWREWTKPRPGDARWLALQREHALHWLLAEQEDAQGADAPDAEQPTAHDAMPDEAELARAAARPDIHATFLRLRARRDDRDILSEAASLVVTAPCALLLALMLTSSVVTWTGFDRGPAVVALAAGAALHFAANLVPARNPTRRAGLRYILMIAVILPAAGVAKARHPYLLMSGPERRRTVAERVWSLGLTVEAGRYAGLLFAYARDLEAEKRWADSVVVYERGLVLDAYAAEAHLGLARAKDALGDAAGAAESRATAAQLAEAKRHKSSRATTSSDTATPPQPNAPLPLYSGQPANRLKVCLVPMGEVPEGLLEPAAAALRAELDVEVYRFPETLALPEAGRRAGLLGSAQWHPGSLLQKLGERLGPRLPGTWQFVVITDADLFLPESNYVFAASGQVHGVVSFARFGAEPRRSERMAKQLVATAIKSFGVRQSTRPDCVTAYVRSLDELDRRVPGPSPATLAAYRARVAQWETNPALPPAR